MITNITTASRILAIETSTQACSVAVYNAGEILTQLRVVQNEHTKIILPMIDDLLEEAGISLCDIDYFCYGCGPGSFTGLRIAAGITQGLAYGVRRPVIAISSLQALAQQFAHSAQTVLAMIDARIDEVYWGWYEVSAEGIVQPIAEEQLSRPQAVTILKKDSSFVGVGSGWQRYAEILPDGLLQAAVEIESEILPRAEEIIMLAMQPDNVCIKQAHEALPHYLRDKVTH